jgi:hypothetical protein
MVAGAQSQTHDIEHRRHHGLGPEDGREGVQFYVGNDVLNDALRDKIVTAEAEMAARLVEESEQNKT